MSGASTATATVSMVGAGMPGASSGATLNSLGPIYNAYLMSQILGTPNASGNSNGSSPSSTNANSASASTAATSTSTSTSTSSGTASGLFAATNPTATTGGVSGLRLPNVQDAIHVAPTTLQAPLAVTNVATPPMDPQGSSTSLPPAQAGDVVRPGMTAAGDSGTIPDGIVAPAPLPEPGPFVLLAVAFGIHLGRNWLRRHDPAGKR